MIYVYGYLMIAMLVSIYIQKELNEHIEEIYFVINTYCPPDYKRMLEDYPWILKWLPFIAGIIWPYTFWLYINRPSNKL